MNENPTSPASANAAALHGPARTAGALYAVVVATGTFSLGIAPRIVFAGDTPAALAASITAHETLLRASIASEAACYIAFAGLALALYRLLRGVDANAAAVMAMLVLISVPFGFSNLTYLVEIQRAVESGAASSAPEELSAAFAHYRAGVFLQSVPWGLWLIPFGVLVIRSGFLPSLLGVVLILAGAGYVAHFLGRLLVPGYAQSIWPDVFGAPRIGEILICLWLLVFGARRRIWPFTQRAPAVTT